MNTWSYRNCHNDHLSPKRSNTTSIQLFVHSPNIICPQEKKTKKLCFKMSRASGKTPLKYYMHTHIQNYTYNYIVILVSKEFSFFETHSTLLCHLCLPRQYACSIKEIHQERFSRNYEAFIISRKSLKNVKCLLQ